MPMPMLSSPSSSVLMKPRSSAGRLDSMTSALKKVSSRDIGHSRTIGAWRDIRMLKLEPMSSCR